MINRGLCLLAVTGIMLSCTTKKNQGSVPTIVEVQAIYDAENNRHLFQTDTDTIPSGWTTFRFTNASPMLHFMAVERYPGDRTSKDAANEVAVPFQDAMDLIIAGNREEGLAKLADLPGWFSEVVFTGGPGFTSPGKTTDATVYLQPGNYVLECYIKTSDGVFHGMLGMIRDLKVTSDTTEATAPVKPTIEITLTNEDFDVQGELTPGKHLVAVHFEAEEPPLLGNDVQVVQLSDEGASIDSIASWMDWSQPMGLVSTAENPAPAVFLGGTHEAPEGSTAYFTVELQPGRYAWISERPASIPLYREFTVAEE